MNSFNRSFGYENCILPVLKGQGVIADACVVVVVSLGVIEDLVVVFQVVLVVVVVDVVVVAS